MVIINFFDIINIRIIVNLLQFDDIFDILGTYGGTGILTRLILIFQETTVVQLISLIKFLECTCNLILLYFSCFDRTRYNALSEFTLMVLQ